MSTVRSTSEPKLFSNPMLYLGMFLMPFDRASKEKIAYSMKFRIKGRGYFMEQATKPQTLGYGLEDSPVGLLAWVYEKLVDWTDEYPWTDDEGLLSIELAMLLTRLTTRLLLSAKVDFHLLVLARRPICIDEDLLRDD